jgi:hypothetical protein
MQGNMSKRPGCPVREADPYYMIVSSSLILVVRPLWYAKGLMRNDPRGLKLYSRQKIYICVETHVCSSVILFPTASEVGSLYFTYAQRIYTPQVHDFSSYCLDSNIARKRKQPAPIISRSSPNALSLPRDRLSTHSQNAHHIQHH